MANKTEMLIAQLEPLAAEHGLDLVTVEIAGTNKNPILRVFLDTPQGGIDLDQLAAAQRWVDERVEELDPFACSYMLEVSSPGIDRPLRKPQDYQRWAGEEVVIHLKHSDPKTKVKGTLAGLRDDSVVVTTEEGEHLVSLDNIKRANIIGRIDFGGAKN